MQIVKLHPGRYVVAVSGGVDSMALLHMLQQDAALDLIVAHVNHGMRPDAAADETLVKNYAQSHNMQFVSTRLDLGTGASEDKARRLRYDFLRSCCKTYNARAIVTAHHQDDVIETVLINLLRGTGWRGLAPFTQAGDIVRPLMQWTKTDILAYARRNSVAWREDSTNKNEAYLRNYVRHSLVSVLNQKSDSWEAQLLQLVRSQQKVRANAEELLSEICTQWSSNKRTYSRHNIIMIDPAMGYQVIQHIMRTHTAHSLQRQLAEQALLFIKVAKSGKVMPLNNMWRLRVTRRDFIVEPTPVVVS